MMIKDYSYDAIVLDAASHNWHVTGKLESTDLPKAFRAAMEDLMRRLKVRSDGIVCAGPYDIKLIVIKRLDVLIPDQAEDL